MASLGSKFTRWTTNLFCVYKYPISLPKLCFLMRKIKPFDTNKKALPSHNIL